MLTNDVIITRFAPSPTGYLHIGGARTALFNYLFAKHHGGKFLLRIEDTDKARSTPEATQAIIDGLKWLDICWDENIIYQSARADRHIEIAHKLVKSGQAYYCFTKQEIINQQREIAIAQHQHFLFNSPWREANANSFPANASPVIRIKAPRHGQTIVRDLLQGDVITENSQLDDMILLRSDGSPTYMLSVVVDDFDMGITHIIRGDDHLNNAARQMLIYQAMQWPIPKFVHIPLIHGMDGNKLSKRHGALGVNAYQKMGYLPAALNNYLLRLGWSHGNDEFISAEQAITWFDIDTLGKSPARLDFDKMQHINAHYIKQMTNDNLSDLVIKIIEESATVPFQLPKASRYNILQAMDSLKLRSKTLLELAAQAIVFTMDFMPEYSKQTLDILENCDIALITEAIDIVSEMADFTYEHIQFVLKDFAKHRNVNISEIMKIFRILITGQLSSSSIFEMMAILGKDIILNRLKQFKSLNNS